MIYLVNNKMTDSISKNTMLFLWRLIVLKSNAFLHKRRKAFTQIFNCYSEPASPDCVIAPLYTAPG